jgi:hypothetical protein
MSVRKTLALFLPLSALLFLFGCGSSSPKPQPPPSGAFSNSTLNGTYTFSSLGTDANGSLFAIAGSLTANGSGGITGGAVDLNDPGLGQFPNLAIQSSSSYRVTSDGRGTATIVTASGNIGLDFVLTSSSHGLVTRFDSGGSGSGSLDLQGTVLLAGPYTFTLSGVDSSGASPIVTAGAFTVNGSSITGVADVNDNRFAFPNLPVTGSIALGTGTGPGTATIVAGSFTFNFDVYTVDSTHLKLIETDVAPVVEGDAFTQQTSIPSGQLVFTTAGLDSTSGPLATGGYVTSDGTGLLTNGFQDADDAGSVFQLLPFSGSFVPVSGGRTVLTLNTFFNSGSGTSTFAAYPSSGGIQLVEIDNAGITSGAVFAQTNSSFASPQGYGFNLSAFNSVEEDDIAEFTASSGTLTGLIDQNDQGSGTPGQAITGTYTLDTGNTGRGEVTTTFFTGNMYVVNGSSVLFAEMDRTQVGTGSFGLQTSTAQAGVVMSHFATMRPKGSPKVVWGHK